MAVQSSEEKKKEARVRIVKSVSQSVSQSISQSQLGDIFACAASGAKNVFRFLSPCITYLLVGALLSVLVGVKF